VHAVRVSNDGLVYVADRGNSRVQVFTLDGKYQTQVFVNRKDKSAATACGLALSADPQQRFLYVSDFGNGHLWILDRKSLRVLGHFGEQGPQPGNFRNAHHMATDSKGNLYTAEVNPGSRVQKFVFKGLKPQSTAASAGTR
jgi:DNA-binding beta-propeller fold protein YncE